jgi:putative phosphoesterase
MSNSPSSAVIAVPDARCVGLISDTHNRLRTEVFDIFAGVDLILHAGDIGDPTILTELAAIAPVYAVFGNTDGFAVRAIAGESLVVDAGGRRIVVVHGHLLGSPGPQNLRAAFPDCDVIVYGHTHRQLVDDSTKPLVVNPGAAGAARFNLKPCVAILDLAALAVTLVPLADHPSE